VQERGFFAHSHPSGGNPKEPHDPNKPKDPNDPKDKDPDKDPADPKESEGGAQGAASQLAQLAEQTAKLQQKIDLAKQHSPGTLPPPATMSIAEAAQACGGGGKKGSPEASAEGGPKQKG
jgi:hypothetical protein